MTAPPARLLVYTAAAAQGAPEECALLAKQLLRSLYTFCDAGSFDLLLVGDAPRLAALLRLRDVDPFAYDVMSLPRAAPHQAPAAHLAPLAVADYPGIQRYERVLYLDLDMVVQSDVVGLAARAAGRGLHAAAADAPDLGGALLFAPTPANLLLLRAARSRGGASLLASLQACGGAPDAAVLGRATRSMSGDGATRCYGDAAVLVRFDVAARGQLRAKSRARAMHRLRGRLLRSGCRGPSAGQAPPGDHQRVHAV